MRFSYTLVSTSNFANRHTLKIIWSKVQELLDLVPLPHFEHSSSPKAQHFTMVSISTPDAKQSEAYVATTALFLIFGSSSREDKVFLRLPPVWRDLWTEFAELRKEQVDEEDRGTVGIFRDMVRKKKDQELEDGVLIQGAFRGRGPARAPDSKADSGGERTPRAVLSPEAYYAIWVAKSSTATYQAMLVRFPA